jgi:hypothetical protein
MLLDWEEPVLYFVTLCVRVRQPVLAKRQIYDAFLNGISFIQSWTMRAAVIMPDHL